MRVKSQKLENRKPIKQKGEILMTKKVEEKAIRISKIAIALQKSLDLKNGGDVASNLDHLYKHIRFAVARVMDHNDYSYLTSAEKVTAEINKGWEKISSAA